MSDATDWLQWVLSQPRPDDQEIDPLDQELFSKDFDKEHQLVPNENT